MKAHGNTKMFIIHTKVVLSNMSIIGHEEFAIAKVVDTELYKMKIIQSIKNLLS